MRRFQDRVDAGRRLAARLGPYRSAKPVVLGLPRGGVPVAAEVARALGVPLDVIVVRKLGVPWQPELGMGAVGESGVTVLNEDVLSAAGVTGEQLEVVESHERAEVARRAQRLREGRPALNLHGRTVIIVDDGLATGATARAAIEVARAQGASEVILAVPVGAVDSVRELSRDADEVVCVETPSPFSSIGQWYEDFSPTSEDEVVNLLAQAAGAPLLADEGGPPEILLDEEVRIAAGSVELLGQLTVPHGAVGVVVFAHGSGSSRRSPRNQYVARALNEAHLATLLFDLLTPDEERDRANVFDIELLGERLVLATQWLTRRPDVTSLPVGYFGASTGAGAALWAAASDEITIRAVVSRGGRPDLAGARLEHVSAPTLLIVGGNDEVVLELNQQAARRLAGPHRIVVLAGATHLFEEPGALEAVADHARHWFRRHFIPEPSGSNR